MTHTAFLQICRESFVIGDSQIELEVGRIARQAESAVVLREGKTMLLATVVTSSNSDISRDPYLFIEYRERMYSAGRIPGNYFRREMRPNDSEILTSRLIDRCIRSILPPYCDRSINLRILVLSADPNSDIESLSLIVAGAAIYLSNIPVVQPVTGLRITQQSDQLQVLNCGDKERSDCEVFIGMTPEGVVMIDGKAFEINPEVLIDAAELARDCAQPVFEALAKLRAAKADTSHSWEPRCPNPELISLVSDLAAPVIDFALSQHSRQACHKILQEARQKTITQLLNQTPVSITATIDAHNKHIALESSVGDEDAPDQSDAELVDEQSLSSENPKAKDIASAFDEVLRHKIRTYTLSGRRIDGRLPEEMRPIDCEIGILPMSHGSAIFTKGDTQSLVSVSLGKPGEGQHCETLSGNYVSNLLVHYNFHAFATGHFSRIRVPSFREHGHGHLARRAISPLLPSPRQLNRTIRIVSEITESAGSSSMSSICGATLALFDAGIDLRRPLAGVSIGLVKEADQYVLLSDITDDEDIYGDIDAKIAGTTEGFTAIQLSSQRIALSSELLQDIVKRATIDLHSVIEILKGVIPEPSQPVRFEQLQLADIPSRSDASGSQTDIPTNEHTSKGLSHKAPTDEHSYSQDEVSTTATEYGDLYPLDELDQDANTTQSSPQYAHAVKYDIDPSMIGRVIGTRGRNIRMIGESLAVACHIDNDGVATIAGNDLQNIHIALNQIKALTINLKSQQFYLAVLLESSEKGAFARIGDHIGWIDPSDLEQISLPATEIMVKISGINNKGQLLFTPIPHNELPASTALNFVPPPQTESAESAE
jgi:polyribonucleotide nucleotidyltransferase